MNQPRTFLGILIILVGLSTLVEFPFFRIAFAVFIIWLGFRVLSGQTRGSATWVKKHAWSEDTLNRALIFSGIDAKVTSSAFRGGEVVAVFGGGQIDLSAVKSKKTTIEMEIVAVFGGLKLIVPDSWSVRSEGVSLLGDFANHTKIKSKKTTELLLKGAAVFGGVEVVN